jgi:hypothetical protein
MIPVCCNDAGRQPSAARLNRVSLTAYLDWLSRPAESHPEPTASAGTKRQLLTTGLARALYH